jgi:hypothetical protein
MKPIGTEIIVKAHIKKIAEQAGIQHRIEHPNEIWGWDGNVEKFAELLVREVLTIADEVDTGTNNPEWLICERLGINHDWRNQDNFWK